MATSNLSSGVQDTTSSMDHNYAKNNTSTSCPTLSQIVQQLAKDTESPSPSSQRPPYGGKYCCAVDCHNNEYRDNKRGVKFHRFPKNPVRRKLWEAAVKRQVDGGKDIWRASPHDVICSEHFVGGKKNDDPDSVAYIPSIFPTHILHHASQMSSAREERKIKREKMKALLLNKKHGADAENLRTKDAVDDYRVASFEKENEDTFSSDQSMETLTQEEDQLSDQINSSMETGTEFQSECTDEMEVTESANSEKIKLDYKVQANLPHIRLSCKMEVKCCYVDDISSNEKATQVDSVLCQKTHVKSKTSQTIPTEIVLFSTFNARQITAFCGVKHNFIEFLLYRTGDQIVSSRKLTREAKMMMLFAKLKLNTSFSVLGGLFGVSEATAVRCFYDTLDVVYNCVKKDLIYFDKKTIQSRMPNSFRSLYPKTRAIIDCTEVETETPSTVRARNLCYSSYKSRYTLKFLVAIAPSGEITFISPAYGGRATDSQITVSSGFLKLIEDGDVIMSDKGFPSIEANINEAGGILVMPPFKKGHKQFSAKENKDCYECASVRVHVERCIGRLKRFEVLCFVPENMRKSMDKILVILSFVNNCFNDLIRDESDD